MNMETGQSDVGAFGDSERKRENRLTTIIDQLLSNKANKTVAEATATEEGEHRREVSSSSTSPGGEGTVSSSTSISKLMRTPTTSNHPDNETPVPHVTISKTPLTKARRKKLTRGLIPGVKNERCSPDPEVGTESSRSGSPHSPGSSSFRTQTPSFPGTPPNPPFTPPERFSPASFNNNNKFIMEGIHMSRNYSDFMRSLAAKYNNSNPNEYRNGYIPSLDSRFSSYKASAAAALPLLNLPLGTLGPAVAAAAKKDLEAAAAVAAAAAAAGGGGGGSKKSESPTLPLSLPGLIGGLNPALNHPGLPAGLSPFPMIDMSSTQALLNIVRSASAQNAHQLETYLRGTTTTTTTTPNVGAMKRPAESSASISHSPLDLSATMAKRPHLDPQTEAAGRGFRDLFGLKSSATENDLSKASKHSVNGKKSPVSTANPSATSPRGEKRVATPKTVSLPIPCRLACAADTCSPGAVQVQGWTVEDVVDFVKSIDLCAEYSEIFRDHSIDGSTLPLLTEDHLISNMNMKLGPALKLRSVLAKKIGHCAVCLHCVHCHSKPTGPSSSSQDSETSAELSTSRNLSQSN